MAYRVVLVEDDPMVLSINRRYMEKDGRFEVCGGIPGRTERTGISGK